MKKRVRCMADGGIVETPEQMMARMNAKVRAGGAGTSPTAETSGQAAAAPRSQQTADASPARRSCRRDRTAQRRVETRRRTTRAAASCQSWGSAAATSDSIPVVVAGQRVNLSNGEGGNPAGKTMKNKAAVNAIEGIIEGNERQADCRQRRRRRGNGFGESPANGRWRSAGDRPEDLPVRQTMKST